ncbi:MAG TPA: restriction endonuclease subunit S [Aquimonas sp.]|nr:restriction endonuclease subunit S [Aquimonas sp.]HRF55111.1 restriction endonuclease subunit S [Aquimonas sp.]
MSHYTPYPAYKDSGVEWIGRVPEHWEVKRFKFAISNCRNGIWGDDPTGHDDTPCVRVADFDRSALRVNQEIPTLRAIPERDRASRLLRPGNLLLEKSGGGDSQPVGQVVLYDQAVEAVCSNFIARMELVHRADPSFWRYQFAGAYACGLNLRSVKQTSGIQNLDQEQYLDEMATYPPPAEQSAIAAALDRETARIDALIAKKTRFIELLKEKRQALITHAVTKGLDPNVRMKDSGVAWIGEVPEHWENKRIAFLFAEAIRTGDPALPVLSISIHDGITDEEVSQDDRDRRVWLSEDRTKYKRVEPGDIAYNMMRAWQGAFGAVTVRGLVSPAYVVAAPVKPIETAYMECLLRTPMAIEEMRRFSRGIADFRMRLYWDEFRNLSICLPPLKEQRAILDHIATSSARFNTIVAATDRSIALLKERRSALITAAVTGQIDLREDAA